MASVLEKSFLKLHEKLKKNVLFKTINLYDFHIIGTTTNTYIITTVIVG